MWATTATAATATRAAVAGLTVAEHGFAGAVDGLTDAEDSLAAVRSRSRRALACVAEEGRPGVAGFGDSFAVALPTTVTPAAVPSPEPRLAGTAMAAAPLAGGGDMPAALFCSLLLEGASACAGVSSSCGAERCRCAGAAVRLPESCLPSGLESCRPKLDLREIGRAGRACASNATAQLQMRLSF